MFYSSSVCFQINGGDVGCHFSSTFVYRNVFCSLMAEFQPGVPWKGIQNSGDPESDPYMTPGSVLGSPGPQSLNDSDHQLLRDNIGI